MSESITALRRVGITGTDTGIGKTVLSCALAARARQLGIRVAAMAGDGGSVHAGRF